MPNTPYNLTTNVTLESALPLDSDITSALQQATLLISGKLQQFADDSAFGDKIQVAFGTAVNTDELQSQWQAGDLTGFPIMEIVAGNDLNGANGAYAIVNNRIYLSYEFLSQNQGNLGAIVALLLEEYGHYVDGLLNSTDAPGDEGAIFASLVLGESLSEEALAYMKAEDDAGVISIGGVSIAVERATTTEPSLVADINSTSFGSNPSNFIKIGDILYFTANDDVNGIELWRANPATGVMSGTYTVTATYGDCQVTDQVTVTVLTLGITNPNLLNKCISGSTGCSGTGSGSGSGTVSGSGFGCGSG